MRLFAVVALLAAVTACSHAHASEQDRVEAAIIHGDARALGPDRSHVASVFSCQPFGRTTIGTPIYFCILRMDNSTSGRIVCASFVHGHLETVDEEESGCAALRSGRGTVAPTTPRHERWTELTWKCEDVDAAGRDVGPAIVSNANDARDFDANYYTEEQARQLARHLHLRFGIDC